jgi:hypothetical protein
MVEAMDQSNPRSEPNAVDEGDRPWSYDRAITRGWFGGVRPDDRPIFDLRSSLSLVGGLAIIVVGALFYRAPLPVRIAVAIALLAAYVLLIRAFFVTWRAAMARAHLSVIDRPELGDVRRWSIFGVALFGYPLLWLMLFLFGPLALQAIGSS